MTPSSFNAVFPQLTAALKRRLLLLALSALLAVWLGFLAFSPVTAANLVTNYGYIAMLGTLTAFLSFIWKVWRESRAKVPLAGDTQARRTSVLVIIAAWLFTLLSEPFNYKILYDEFVLQATAFNIHLNREISTLVRGYDVNGSFISIDTYLDKRPYFFAFLLSLVHDTIGYRPENAFVLNAALALLILSLIYLFARRLTDHGGGILAVLLFATLPLFGQNATGSGMELLNLAMILAGLLLGSLWLEERTPLRLSAFCFAVVLLAQTRYESAFYVVPAGLVILAGWWREGRPVVPWALVVMPLLLVPYALQNLVLSNNKVLWELPENINERFSIAHVGANLLHAAHFLFNTSRDLANSWWLSLLGAAALLFFSACFIKGRGRAALSPSALALVCFSLAILGNLGLLMFYFWGGLDDWTVARLSLPFLLLLVFVAVAAGHAINRRIPVMKLATAGTLIYGVAFTYPAFSHYLYTSQNLYMQELAWERRLLDSRGAGYRLVVTNKSCLPWLVEKTPSILLDRARARQKELQYHLEQDTFREIIVSQRLRPTTESGDFAVDVQDRLPPNFLLEPIATRRFGMTIDRVSRLVAVEPIPDKPNSK